VKLRHLAHEIQAEPGRFASARRTRQRIEAVKDARARKLGDAWPLIFHDKADRFIRFREADANRGSGRRMTQGILQKIGEGLRNQIPISADACRFERVDDQRMTGRLNVGCRAITKMRLACQSSV